MKKICRVKDCDNDAERGLEVGKMAVCRHHYDRIILAKQPLIFKAYYQGGEKKDRRSV